MTIEELRIQKIQQALDRYVTVIEAAKALQCSKRTVFRYIEAGLVTRQNHYNCRPNSKESKIFDKEALAILKNNLV